MATVTVKTPAGADAGSIELDATTFGIEPNVPVMHQVVTAQLAARRSGTQSTKTRAEVSGGGGVALGPKPRSYDQRTPKKMIRLALRSALSDRAAEGRVVVVDQWGWDSPSTKAARAAVAALGIEGRALVVLRRDDEAIWKSFRNLADVQVIDVRELNTYDVLVNDWVVFTTATLPTGQEAE